MDGHQLPQLPPGGDSNLLSTISQSLAFHSSPDVFLSTRQTTDSTHGQSAPAVVRAKILNRDVAVISSYEHCKDILAATDSTSSSAVPAETSIRTAHEGDGICESTFGVLPAYRQLMVDFFPAPNLLLLDTPHHRPKRQVWDEHMSKVCQASSAIIRQIVTEELSTWLSGPNPTIDLYEKMKDLSWRILLAIFLDVDPAQKEYHTMVSLQENLLRGQFSLFPVSISTPFWRSARSRGLDARSKLQQILRENMDTQRRSCPFNHESGIDKEEAASNFLLFTSSIAVKALSSLLTASLLNLFLSPGQQSLAFILRGQDSTMRQQMLRSILLETERLSPPVIGVMRRVQQDIILKSRQMDQVPTLVPTGWDAWLYFVGAGRDPSVYEQANKFVPERFMSEASPEPGFAFGFGGKTCLGRDITRQIVETVAMVILDMDLCLEGSVTEPGVQGWLGWDENVPVETIARDLKQLPCQRPRKPIRLHVVRKS